MYIYMYKCICAQTHIYTKKYMYASTEVLPFHYHLGTVQVPSRYISGTLEVLFRYIPWKYCSGTLGVYTKICTFEAYYWDGCRSTGCVKINVEAIVMPHPKQINSANDQQRLGYKALHVHVKSNVQQYCTCTYHILLPVWQNNWSLSQTHLVTSCFLLLGTQLSPQLLQYPLLVGSRHSHCFQLTVWLQNNV